MQAGVGVRVMEGIGARSGCSGMASAWPASGSRTSTHSCLVPCRQRSRTCVPFDARTASSRLHGQTSSLDSVATRVVRLHEAELGDETELTT